MLAEAYLVLWCMIYQSRLFYFKLISSFDAFDQLTLFEVTSSARHSLTGRLGGPSAIDTATSDQR